MVQAFLSVGANLGDRRNTCQQALEALDSSVGIRVVAVSGEYETEPMEKTDQPDFINLAVQVETERVRRLERADRRITQRINLFEKILIPGAQENIRRIRIFLGDAEMAAVVRSKIAKGIHERKRRNAEASAGEAG